MEKQFIAVIGSGIVGKSWAMLFASAGHEVRLYDAVPAALHTAMLEIREMLKSLEQNGDLKNSDKFNAKEQGDLIVACSTLEEALKDVTYIQECTPETLDMKRAVFSQIDQVLSSIGNFGGIIGSSSSTIPSSKFAIGLRVEKRSLVAHPVNPPYFMRLVELVPNEVTYPEVIIQVHKLMTSLGQRPIVLKKEVIGFAQNRVQYAILNATWTLVKDGILSVEDADTVTREGLAPRYVFMGPLETAQLNANGFLDYCERYGSSIHEVSIDSQSIIPKLYADAAVEIDKELQKLVPNSELPQRRQWRDKNLADLSKLKRKLSL